MRKDYLILYSIYACTFFSLAFIPKNKRKEASVAFIFQQGMTWGLGLLAVELHLIEYPVRELANVNKTSFLYEFLVYPTYSAFFCIYYPHFTNKMIQICYTSAFATFITIPEVIFERYTQLIHYLHWEWYITWISVFITLYLLWFFYRWYFKVEQKKKAIP